MQSYGQALVHVYAPNEPKPQYGVPRTSLQALIVNLDICISDQCTRGIPGEAQLLCPTESIQFRRPFKFPYAIVLRCGYNMYYEHGPPEAMVLDPAC